MSIKVPYEALLQIVWKKGKDKLCVTLIDQKRIETKSMPEISPTVTQLSFAEKISLIGSLYKEKNS